MLKKKILFVLEAFDKGGIEKVTLDIVNNLNPDEYDITIKTIWYGGYCQSQVKPHIKVEPFFKRYVKGMMRLFIYLPKPLLYKLYIHDKYDVEIAAGDGIPSRIIAGSLNKKSKKVSWIHMDVIKRGSTLKEFNDIKRAFKVYKNFDKIACVSNECRENFIKKFGFSEKTVVCYNPIPSKEIQDLSREKVDIEINKDEFNIVSVGRLVQEKGYDRLLRAHKKLIEDGIIHKIYIIGDGELKEELEDFIEKNNLKDTVILLGFQSNPYKYIKDSDLLLISSRDEAFSLVVAEAIVLGIPIMSTRCCGPVELLNNGEYGYLVDNSLQGIYEGLKNILNNPDLYQYYFKQINKRRDFFDFHIMLKDFENQIL